VLLSVLVTDGQGERKPLLPRPRRNPGQIQRCTNHKLWNLLAKAPAHLREELAEVYRRMIYADSREAVETAHAGFLRKWRLRCKAVVNSLEEADEELFTFLQFPKLGKPGRSSGQ
jgi:putative transposase